MGLIWSRFRSKTSTKDILEDIEKKLKSIEEFQQDTLERKKRVVRRLLVATVVVYLLAVVAFLLIGAVRSHKLYFFGGLFIFAILVWTSHKTLRWHYTRRMQKNAEKSVELRKRKQKILEEVMDTETYKVAKEILDKFGDKSTQKPLELKPTLVQQGQQNVNRPQAHSGTPGTELRHRHVENKAIPPRSNMQPQPQLVPTHMNATPSMKLPQQLQSVQRPVAMNYGHAPLRPLPRPILPRERGVVDRVMDFFVGDGPNQRYALICRHCGGHNGMALQEEFEYVSYYCCYCLQFNPARKQRPMGPRLPMPTPPPATPQTPPLQSEGGDKETKEANKSGDEEVDDESSSETDDTDHEEESTGSKSEEADKAPPKADETSEGMEVDNQDDEPASDSVSNDENGPGLR